MDRQNRTAFIFGLGFSGMVLARLLRDQGWQVRGTRREPGESDGISIHAFAAGTPLANPAAALDGVTHVISTIPVIGGEDPVLAAHGDDLARLGCWAGYVSATSVYTEADGGWVTEESPAEPTVKRGQWRRAAEMAWQEKLSAEVFRAAGIYGPGRSPFRNLLEGKARIILKPGHQFNRIHVDDIARVIAAAMLNPSPRRILNLADGSPCEAGDVIRYAADLIGVPPPVPVAFDHAEMSPMARSFYATSRRVDSSRIARDLGLDLLYPDYRSGMRAVLAAERAAGILPADEEMS
ncbi:MAG: SDR family oxidoreductase [Candidatus Puniceispirillales bacterium]